jgi:hypothetical protein
MVSPGIDGSASQKKINKSCGHKSLVHYGHRPRNRRPEIAKAALVDGNQVPASDRKPEAVTEALGTYL